MHTADFTQVDSIGAMGMQEVDLQLEQVRQEFSQDMSANTMSYVETHF